jgi:hypothetical protein
VGIVVVDDGGCTEQCDWGVLGAQRNGRFSATYHAQLWRMCRPLGRAAKSEAQFLATQKKRRNSFFRI